MSVADDSDSRSDSLPLTVPTVSGKLHAKGRHWHRGRLLIRKGLPPVAPILDRMHSAPNASRPPIPSQPLPTPVVNSSSFLSGFISNIRWAKVELITGSDSYSLVLIGYREDGGTEVIESVRIDDLKGGPFAELLASELFHKAAFKHELFPMQKKDHEAWYAQTFVRRRTKVPPIRKPR